jgi:hypothetical protein
VETYLCLAAENRILKGEILTVTPSPVAAVAA